MSPRPLIPTILHFSTIPQFLLALPCTIYLVARTYAYWSHPYDTWYWFTNFLLAAGACAGIVFVAAVGWRATLTPREMVRLEVVKAVLATGMFVWTNFVAGQAEVKKGIVTGAGVVVLFYAPLWLAYVYWRKGGEGGGCRGCGDLGERTPLMRESGKI